MSSNRLRQAEIKTERIGKRGAALARKAERKAAERTKRTQGQVAVDANNLSPNGSYSTPDFVARGHYLDLDFECKACGKPQVWTATQQRWWYEVAKGDVWKIAVLCRPCRALERERKNAARKVHLDGMAKKALRAG